MLNSDTQTQFQMALSRWDNEGGACRSRVPQCQKLLASVELPASAGLPASAELSASAEPEQLQSLPPASPITSRCISKVAPAL